VQERCLTFSLYGLAISLAYRSGEDGGIFLVQMIYTCRRGAKGGGGSASYGRNKLRFNKVQQGNWRILRKIPDKSAL
jgi:hypothetical protein